MKVNVLTIIIDRASVKPILWWRFSGKDSLTMGAGFLIGFYPTKAVTDDLVGLIAGGVIFILLGILLVEMPNHLSIYDHIKKWYKYKFKDPEAYYYIPQNLYDINQNQNEEDKDTPGNLYGFSFSNKQEED